MRIKTYLHWKNIAKTFCVITLTVLFVAPIYIHFELPIIWAATIGAIVGLGTAIYCTNRWELWHFEL